MFLAISEIAVAIIVTSVSEKPSCRASSCPAWRAATMSSELLTSTTKSVGTVAPDRRLARVQLPIQQRKPFFEVQRRLHVVEHQAELDHGEGHLRLQADDHRIRAAQPRHVGDRAYRPGGEGIHHVDRGDVDDDAVCAAAAAALHQVWTKPLGVGVGERGLYRSDEDCALFQNGYWHE